MKALVLDDNRVIRELMVTVCGLRGMLAVTCAGYYEAQRVLERDSSFDLLILDLDLGGGPTGWDLLAWVRAREATAHIPVVLFTGDSVTGSSHKQLLETVSAVMPKQQFSMFCFDRILGRALPG